MKRRSLLKTILAAPLALLGIKLAKAEVKKPGPIDPDREWKDLWDEMHGKPKPLVSNVRCVSIHLSSDVSWDVGRDLARAFGCDVEIYKSQHRKPPPGTMRCLLYADLDRAVEINGAVCSSAFKDYFVLEIAVRHNRNLNEFVAGILNTFKYEVENENAA